MTNPTASNVISERPAGGGANIGADSRDFRRTPKTPPKEPAPAPKSRAPVARANPLDFGGGVRVALWDAFANGVFLWVVALIAFVFGVYGVVLGFENEDRSKLLIERVAQSDAAAAQMSALAQRVESIAAAQSGREGAERDERDELKHLETTFDRGLARVGARLDEAIGNAQTKDAAFELRLGKLEAAEELAAVSPARLSPLSPPHEIEASPTPLGQVQGSQPQQNNRADKLFGTDIVSPAALEGIEGRTPVVTERKGDVTSSITKNGKRRRQQHPQQRKTKASAGADIPERP